MHRVIIFCTDLAVRKRQKKVEKLRQGDKQSWVAAYKGNESTDLENSFIIQILANSKWNCNQKDYSSYFYNPISEETRLCIFSANEKGDVNPPSVTLFYLEKCSCLQLYLASWDERDNTSDKCNGKREHDNTILKHGSTLQAGKLWKWELFKWSVSLKSVFQMTASWKSKSTVYTTPQFCPQLFFWGPS